MPCHISFLITRGEVKCGKLRYFIHTWGAAGLIDGRHCVDSVLCSADEHGVPSIKSHPEESLTIQLPSRIPSPPQDSQHDFFSRFQAGARTPSTCLLAAPNVHLNCGAGSPQVRRPAVWVFFQRLTIVPSCFDQVAAVRERPSSHPRLSLLTFLQSARPNRGRRRGKVIRVCGSAIMLTGFPIKGPLCQCTPVHVTR